MRRRGQFVRPNTEREQVRFYKLPSSLTPTARCTISSPLRRLHTCQKELRLGFVKQTGSRNLAFTVTTYLHLNLPESIQRQRSYSSAVGRILSGQNVPLSAKEALLAAALACLVCCFSCLLHRDQDTVQGRDSNGGEGEANDLLSTFILAVPATTGASVLSRPPSLRPSTARGI